MIYFLVGKIEEFKISDGGKWLTGMEFPQCQVFLAAALCQATATLVAFR